MYCYAWEFLVPPEHRPAFTAAYGPGGDWVRLFRNDPSYLRTLLLEDRENPEHFVTLDYWMSAEACAAFRQRFHEELATLDRKCEAYTSQERFVGDFDVSGS
jgi:hypothetical protein